MSENNNNVPIEGGFGLGTLHQRVVALEECRKEMNSDIADVRKDMNAGFVQINERVRPQYTILIGFTTLLLALTAGLWSLAITPIKEDINRIMITEERFRETTVPRVEQTERYAQIGLQLEKIAGDIRSLGEKMVLRPEVENLKTDLNARIIELNRRLGK